MNGLRSYLSIRYYFCAPPRGFAREISVLGHNQGLRLDKYLKNMHNVSWAQLQKSLRKKDVYVLTEINGETKRIRDAEYELQANDRIRLPASWLNEQKEEEGDMPNASLDQTSIEAQALQEQQQREVKQFKDMLIYEDKNIMILNKSNGISSQGGQNVNENLVTLGQNYLKNTANKRVTADDGAAAGIALKSKQQDAQYLVVHRLDKVTSGVLLACKNSQTAAIFVLRGSPREFKGTVNLPIYYSNQKHKAVIAGLLDKTESQTATTHYQVVAQFKITENKKNSKDYNFNQNDKRLNSAVMTPPTLQGKIVTEKRDYDRSWGDLCLVKVRIEEGRKHQIRVHMTEAVPNGGSVLGDLRYSKGSSASLHFEKLLEYDTESSIFLHSFQTRIHSEALAKKIIQNQAQNVLGTMEVKDQQAISIQATLPLHFKNLIQRAFNNKADNDASKNEADQVSRLNKLIQDLQI